MATKFISPSWRMPKNSNQSKASNYSIDFNNDGYIGINPGASSGVDLTSFTISAWVKWDTESNSYGTAIRLNTSGDDIWMYVGRSTGFNFGVRFYLGNTQLDDTDLLPLNEWVHVVVRYDESTTSMKIYVDSVEKESLTANKNPSLWNTTSTNQIGANGSSGEKMQGRLSQINIFDYALSTGSISALYNNGIPANPLAVATPPVAYYDLGQGSAYASGSAGIIEPNLAQATGSTVFDFDGTNPDEINCGTGIGDSIGDSYTGGMSISLWFKTDSTGGAEKGLFIFSGGVDAWGEITAYFAFNNIYIRVKGSLVLSHAFTDTTSWHNLFINFLGPTEDNQVYLDGVAIGSPFTYTDLDLNGETLNIGYTYSTAYDYQGEMSNFQVWNTSLSTPELSTLYNNGTPIQSYTDVPQSGSLKAWYKLNLDNSIYNSDDTKWNIQNNFQTPIYNDSLKFFGSYVGGSPSISYPQLRTTTNSVSPGTNGITYSAFIRIPLPVQGSETTLFYANLGSIQVSNKVTFKTEAGGAKYKNFNKDLEDGAWHHVLVYVPTPDGDGNLNDVKCYVDGGEITSTSIIGGSTYVGDITNVYGIYVGNLSPKHWEISNWAYWLGDKTSDLATIYNGGTPGDISSLNPNVWYKLDSDNVSLTGSNGLDYGSAVDSSGNGNSGRIGGEDASTGGPVPIIVNNYPIIAR